MIPNTTFQNKSFINTQDYANSPLGPTISAKQANPNLYASQPLGGPGGPPDNPIPPIPLDGGVLILVLGFIIVGLNLWLKKGTRKPAMNV